MKKNILLGILLLVFSITLIGCTKESNNDQFNGTDIKEIGLKVEAKTIGSTGLTLVFEQYDSSLPKGELEFGEEYYIEKKNDEGEYSLIHTLAYIDYAWNDISYIIKNGEITEHEVDWTWLYGELPDGEYRMKKTITDFIETGKFDKYDAYVYFTIYYDMFATDEENAITDDELGIEISLSLVTEDDICVNYEILNDNNNKYYFAYPHEYELMIYDDITKNYKVLDSYAEIDYIGPTLIDNKTASEINDFVMKHNSLKRGKYKIVKEIWYSEDKEALINYNFDKIQRKNFELNFEIIKKVYSSRNNATQGLLIRVNS